MLLQNRHFVDPVNTLRFSSGCFLTLTKKSLPIRCALKKQASLWQTKYSANDDELRQLVIMSAERLHSSIIHLQYFTHCRQKPTILNETRRT
jgi:hypothetical protein